MAHQVVNQKATIGNLMAVYGYWAAVVAPLFSIASSYKALSSKFINSKRALKIHVTFGYSEKAPVLKGISFVAKAGEKTAIVGDSRGGKSTILKLILRHYDLTAKSLRTHVSHVPQKPGLLNDTILNNVRYGNLTATDGQVQRACEAAGLHQTITSKKDGYMTKVGENGVALSGGEAQRIAIARIILRNPDVVLLDEATAALDSASKVQVQQSLRDVTQGKTTITIAHRLSTIKDSDRILVVEAGRIIESGDHSSLLNIGRKYAMLWRLQSETMYSSLEDKRCLNCSCGGRGVGAD
ncbi:P-loop containing nucleoside triphosphate hydrolase protein [Lentithecium fluviatile CBS 122367]|uniref:P-loop containing nucleoside triphosphate hydrolase protein n=1 Tax=Lentithecium fluviatile CBS 122367 TaxID=1168545 RepID=A0A6G1JNF0_9PLEO|nr:P-loop containing nucleoside triphosphate hydrolase protein [Lentithecium fluviatile CBS 122367]